MKIAYPKSNNERALEQIRGFNQFDKHQITREGPGLWFCGEPGTGIYHFRVIMVPGRIIVTGDIGDMILNVNHRKPLRWALGAKFKPEDTYYPMSKLSHQCDKRGFEPDQVEPYLVERINEERKHGDRTTCSQYIKMLREWRDFPSTDQPREAELEWHEICSRHEYDDPPGFRDHDIGTYFRYQALCWFMQHVTSKDPRFAEELNP